MVYALSKLGVNVLTRGWMDGWMDGSITIDTSVGRVSSHYHTPTKPSQQMK